MTLICFVVIMNLCNNIYNDCTWQWSVISLKEFSFAALLCVRTNVLCQLKLGEFYFLKSKGSWFETPYALEILLSFTRIFTQKVMSILINRNLIKSWKTRRWKWTLSCASSYEWYKEMNILKMNFEKRGILCNSKTWD